eukprot:CAMPEP_0113958062 /NCGR_PEP_ID=MMETSP0011_2-20120614/3134_1 /TAXON_ID=101924 /ORGANISM="Rhodosorus marinus" /LENGTH=113 /DNA_ID=CAMNT_0000968729 /DNA_START=181 /DNA_END=522 /DNA_ORIENTATION=- /assembly_acc=CAM_ASM_000156
MTAPNDENITLLTFVEAPLLVQHVHASREPPAQLDASTNGGAIAHFAENEDPQLHELSELGLSTILKDVRIISSSKSTSDPLIKGNDTSSTMTFLPPFQTRARPPLVVGTPPG